MTSHASGRCGPVVLALTVAVSPALAQSDTAQSPQPTGNSAVEVTPSAAIGSLGSSRIGTAITFPISAKLSVETELGYRRGEGNINALSSGVSVLYALPPLGRIAPYLAAGAGFAEYGIPLALPGRSEILTQSKLSFALNAGGGLKVPLDDQWGLRADARWFRPLTRNASEHWRIYQGASFGVGQRGHAAGER